MKNIEDVDKVIENILEDEIEYTCCGIEITGDVGLCPECLEHI